MHCLAIENYHYDNQIYNINEAVYHNRNYPYFYIAKVAVSFMSQPLLCKAFIEQILKNKRLFSYFFFFSSNIFSSKAIFSSFSFSNAAFNFFISSIDSNHFSIELKSQEVFLKRMAFTSQTRIMGCRIKPYH
jgi:hypothetical protein